jgi:hypothetical protein
MRSNKHKARVQREHGDRAKLLPSPDLDSSCTHGLRGFSLATFVFGLISGHARQIENSTFPIRSRWNSADLLTRKDSAIERRSSKRRPYCWLLLTKQIQRVHVVQHTRLDASSATPYGRRFCSSGCVFLTNFAQTTEAFMPALEPKDPGESPDGNSPSSCEVLLDPSQFQQIHRSGDISLAPGRVWFGRTSPPENRYIKVQFWPFPVTE